MKLVVLGATGTTGLEIVRQAMEHGHAVTAFVRSPERLKRFGDRIAVVRGDVLNVVDLERALEGQDAVISGFGARIPVVKGDTHLLQHFADTLTNAMLEAGTRRVVIESMAFLFKNSFIPPAYLLGRLFFPDLIEDASEMEHVITQSGLDWTIVRPSRLTDKPRSGKYRVREGHLPGFGFTISHADVADFVIKSVEDPSSIGKIVGISN